MSLQGRRTRLPQTGCLSFDALMTRCRFIPFKQLSHQDHRGAQVVGGGRGNRRFLMLMHGGPGDSGPRSARRYLRSEETGEVAIKLLGEADCDYLESPWFRSLVPF